MVFRILGYSDCTLVVHFESGRLLNVVAKFRENVPHPGNLLSSLNCCHVLCLSGRQGNNGLQLAIPSNCSSCHHCHISSSGASSVNTIAMRCIRVGEEEFIKWQITMVSEHVVKGDIEIE